MAVRQKKKPQRFKTVGQPRSQTLTATVERPGRRAGFGPRFTFELGARIGDDLTVVAGLPGFTAYNGVEQGAASASG